MVTADIDQKDFILKALNRQSNIVIKQIFTLEYNNLTKLIAKENFNLEDDAPIFNTASKFEIFSPWSKIYKKLIYLDSDTIIIRNIDNLMNYPDGAMLYNENIGAHSSLFVIEPKNHVEFNLYNLLLKYGPSVDGAILGNLWFFVRSNKDYQIPFDYLQIFDYSLNLGDKDLKGIHFQSIDKPWLKLEAYDTKNEIIKLYIFYLRQVQYDLILLKGEE